MYLPLEMEPLLCYSSSILDFVCCFFSSTVHPRGCSEKQKGEPDATGERQALGTGGGVAEEGRTTPLGKEAGPECKGLGLWSRAGLDLLDKSESLELLISFSNYLYVNLVSSHLAKLTYEI